MVSEDELKKIASLARLEIEPGSVKALTQQLNNILAYVERLNEIDTKEVAPLCHVHEATNVFRDDAVFLGTTVDLKGAIPPVSGTLPLEDALSNAPEKSGRFFKVPLVIE